MTEHEYECWLAQDNPDGYVYLARCSCGAWDSEPSEDEDALHAAWRRHEDEANRVLSVSEFVGTLRQTIEAATDGKVSLTNDSKIVPGPKAEK